MLSLPALAWCQSSVSSSWQLEQDVETAIANLRKVSSNESQIRKDLDLIERSYLDLKNDETIMIDYYERRLTEYGTQLTEMTSRYNRSEQRSRRLQTFSTVSTTGWTLTTILLIVFIII
jgi:septation ring formation regulator EzrA